MENITSVNGISEHEQLKIEIDLTAEFWQNPPMIDLLIDGAIVSRHTLDRQSYCIQNTVNLSMEQYHCLQIRRYNKTDDQCVIDCEVKKDQYVIIDAVIIDGINVQNLIWHKSWYEPDYPEVWARQQRSAGINLADKVIGETWLSHNGIWNFEFSCPFYQFVIAQFK